jgi:predicted SAM-dependent methyltransferase
MSFYIDRPNDVITDNSDLELLHTFLAFPVFMGATSKSRSTDLYADMNWMISRSSGVIQLNPVLDQEVVYAESHGSGSIGPLWDLHHLEFSRFISDLEPTSVLEIGGGHGKLALEFSKTKKIPWTIIEPNPLPIEGCPAKIISGFFTPELLLEESVDTLVHSHVFEHIYEPRQFVRDLATFSEVGSKVAFSVPNMDVMLDRNYTNCLNFEHTVLLGQDTIESLMCAAGFDLITKKLFKDDHSIFYAFRNLGTPRKLVLKNQFEKNYSRYKNYISYHQNLVAKLNQQLEEGLENVFLFGAHVFSQYLIAFGLNPDRITGILDNDPNKWGLRLAGTDLEVHSPAVLSAISDPSIILKAGVYNNEIKKQIQDSINPAAKFIE